MEYQSVRYFVAKSATMSGLKKAHLTNVWACNDRKYPPQPKDMLEQALETNKVVLLFSVNNCHGWHGYASITGPPGSVLDSEIMDKNDKSLENEIFEPSQAWYRFPIKWENIYLQDHGEICLPFSETELLQTIDGTVINKARNYQEIMPQDGRTLCEQIDKHICELTKKKRLRIEAKLARQPNAFFTPSSSDGDTIWKELIEKVESELGKVILACPFGSQRYNVSTPQSDVDMFIVYQATTASLLGFTPPPHTIKNKEGEACDYTIHEVHRFCELLIGGDPRCVETLFLHPSTVICSSPVFNELHEHKDLFLTRSCLEKYLHDAEGSKGLRQLNKWVGAGEAEIEPLTPRLCKLCYVIVRLLQNARDVASHSPLGVFREIGSPEHTLLMNIRNGQESYSSVRQHIERLSEEIKDMANEKKIPVNVEQVRKVTETWLLQLRHENFKL